MARQLLRLGSFGLHSATEALRGVRFRALCEISPKRDVKDDKDLHIHTCVCIRYSVGFVPIYV